MTPYLSDYAVYTICATLTLMVLVIVGYKTFKHIIPFVKDIVDSLRNNDKGFSSRKLTALYLMILYGSGHCTFLYVLYMSNDAAKHDLSKYTIWLMGVDLLGAAFFLGLVTWANLMELKNINKEALEKISKLNDATGNTAEEKK